MGSTTGLADWVARSVADLEADPRVEAVWLEGSLAAGTADEWSDADVHVAIRDDDFDALSQGPEPESVLAAFGPPLGSNRLALGPDLVMVNATVAGPYRLDLYLERASSTPNHPRLAPPAVRFDRTGLTAQLRVDPEAALLRPRFQLSQLVNRYAYGFMWPARCAGRGLPGSMLLNATIVVYEFLVPAMLAQDAPDQMHRELLHAERFLSPRRRRRVEELLDALAGGFSARNQDGGAALVAAHRDLVDGVLTELAAACGQHGVDWPSGTEGEVRSYLNRQLDLEL